MHDRLIYSGIRAINSAILSLGTHVTTLSGGTNITTIMYCAGVGWAGHFMSAISSQHVPPKNYCFYIFEIGYQQQQQKQQNKLLEAHWLS